MSEEGREGGREKKGTVIEKQERGGREEENSGGGKAVDHVTFYDSLNSATDVIFTVDTLPHTNTQTDTIGYPSGLRVPMPHSTTQEPDNKTNKTLRYTRYFFYRSLTETRSC